MSQARVWFSDVGWAWQQRKRDIGLMANVEKNTSALELSPRAHELLVQLFSEASNLNLPVSVAAQVIEIRNWLAGVVNQNQSNSVL